MLYRDTSAIDAINNGTDTPTWVFIGSNRVAKFGYKHTDGWRGYYTVTATKKQGWAEVDPDTVHIAGWVTGDWDDAPEDAQNSNVADRLEAYAKQNDARGFDTLVVYAPTSNVFSTAMYVFEKSRGKLETVKRRKLANNTYLIDNGKRRAIRLHSTDIVTEHGSDALRIDSGGWDSETTRDRIYSFTTCKVWRDKGVTYIDGQKLKDGMLVAGRLMIPAGR